MSKMLKLGRFFIGMLLMPMIGCAGVGSEVVPDSATAVEVKGQSAGRTSSDGGADDTAAQALDEPAAIDSDTVDEAGKEADLPLLDRTQRTVFNVVNATSQRFDSFFGSTELVEGENVTRGRLSVGAQWDQRDGFDERLRLKARFPLPALRQRTSLVLGRAPANDFVDGSSSENIDTLPDRFNDFEDEDWLLGLGYTRNSGVSRGWDFGVGMKLASPVEPYVRAQYRWNREIGNAWLWRVRPLVFVQNQRGAGASLTNILDYAVTSSWMLRSWTILQGEDEIEGLGWTEKLVSYHALAGKNAISYSVYARGETANDVSLQDYGIELLYRKRVARDWFFVDVWTRVSWPREFPEEVRETNWGVGLEFELQFGDWPGRPQER